MVRLFGGLLRLAGWLQNIPNLVTPPAFRLMQIGSAFWQSRALYVAARLDIATTLGDGRLTAEELATHTDAQPDAIYRLLRMLAALGVFVEVSPRVFANNRLSTPLRGDYLGGVRAMILMHNADAMSRPWYEHLEYCVRQGGVPFSIAHGKEFFDYMNEQAEFDDLFSRAMDSVEALSGDSFARDFDWGRFERVIDMGGSTGSKSVAILKRHSQLRALVVDRSHIVRGAERHWNERAPREVLARLRFQAGDLFEPPPAVISDKDVYFLSAVLHGFDDETCVEILRTFAAALGETGACIAVMELAMPDSGADLARAAIDMQMFVITCGRERTLIDWSRLFDRAGLMLEEHVKLRSFAAILVAKRNR